MAIESQILKRKYPAKILLFGEYTVLLGSRALAIPYKKYYGNWTIAHSNFTIEESLLNYLNKKTKHFLSLSKIEGEKKGFDSNIPQRYGLGSSGAFSAAIYDLGKKSSSNEVDFLRKCLSTIEAHFHGKSSGFDPLISYLDRPLIIDKNGTIFSPEVDMNILAKFFLMNSRKQRTNINLISVFLNRIQRQPEVSKRLVKATNDIIDSIENSGFKSIKKLFKQISILQLQYLKPMILDELFELWKKGLETDQYYMKICGAGGGGYYLIYTDDPKLVIPGYHLESINSHNSSHF